jgi:hypothetical protein
MKYLKRFFLKILNKLRELVGKRKMEIENTINRWFEQIKQKLTGGKTYHTQLQLDVDKLYSSVIFLLENYTHSLLLLLNKRTILPAKALLRVISDVCIKCRWCLKGLETSDEEFTARFDRWLHSSLSVYKKCLERQLAILESEYGDEVSSLKEEVKHRISEIESLGLKKENLRITDDLVNDAWQAQPKLNVEALYRRFHEAVHPDLVLFQKLREETDQRIIYKADVEESPDDLKRYCLIMLGYLFEAIYSLNKWDFSDFEEDIKRLREHTKRGK